MSLLDEAIREKKFDTRMLEKNLNRGYVSQDDFEKLQKAMKDDSENAGWMNVDQLSQDLQRK